MSRAARCEGDAEQDGVYLECSSCPAGCYRCFGETEGQAGEKAGSASAGSKRQTMMERMRRRTDLGSAWEN